ncbi:UNVERIFIED_CONTAM: hypothetical protein FKN15_001334 [Acipenser sinensis]
MPRGGKKCYKGRGKQFTNPEEIDRQMRAQREKEENGGVEVESKSSSEEESSDEEDHDKKKKGVEGLIEIENPNRVSKAEKHSMAEEEIEKQQAKERYMKLHLEGKTDQARADLARLALIKKQREEAARKRDDQKKGEREREGGWGCEREREPEQGRVLEMCCYVEKTLAKALADFEVQVEKEVLEPLNRLSEYDLPEILRNKKLFAKLTTDWIGAKNRSSSGGQEEVEETWRKLEQVKDIYSADLYHFATKEDDYANYFIRLLELQAQYHKKSFEILDPMITELKENSNITTSQVSSPSLGVYGVSLATHLRTSSREIALPIEECVKMLLVKGALKSYLREMPQPMMTFELYNDWFKAASEKDQHKKLEGFQELCCKLPPENYNNLRYLVTFLAKLAELQEVNKMSPSNIAIVLGPNLLWPQNEGETLMLDMATASSVQVVKVIEPLVQFADRLFPGGKQTAENTTGFF